MFIKIIFCCRYNNEILKDFFSTNIYKIVHELAVLLRISPFLKDQDDCIGMRTFWHLIFNVLLVLYRVNFTRDFVDADIEAIMFSRWMWTTYFYIFISKNGISHGLFSGSSFTKKYDSNLFWCPYLSPLLKKTQNNSM